MSSKLPDEWHNLLHSLWSRATEGTDYVKAEWMRLESILFRSAEALAEDRRAGAEGRDITISLPREWFELLHRLWTKATASPHYVKADWMKLEQILFRGAGAIARLRAKRSPEEES